MFVIKGFSMLKNLITVYFSEPSLLGCYCFCEEIVVYIWTCTLSVLQSSPLLNDTILYTLLLPRVLNFNFLFQSLTRDISYSVEKLAIDSSLE